jgi:hypothetical protein
LTRMAIGWHCHADGQNRLLRHGEPPIIATVLNPVL